MVQHREHLRSFFSEGTQSNLRHRFMNVAYLQQLQSQSMEAVIKVTRSGFGVTAVKRLSDYIARDMSAVEAQSLLPEEVLEEGQHHKRLQVELETGQILSTKVERDAVIESWAHDFKATESYNRQAWKQKRLDALKEQRALLVERNHSVGLLESEQHRLHKINVMIKGQFDENAVGRRINLKINAPKDTVHLVLSVGGQHDDMGRFRVKKAIRHYLAHNYGEVGYRYMFVEHADTDHLHYHAIIKASNELTGKQLNFDKEDLQLQRHALVAELAHEGIERSATLRRDRAQVLNLIEQGRESLDAKRSWHAYTKDAQQSKGAVASQHLQSLFTVHQQHIRDAIEYHQERAASNEVVTLLKRLESRAQHVVEGTHQEAQLSNIGISAGVKESYLSVLEKAQQQGKHKTEVIHEIVSNIAKERESLEKDLKWLFKKSSRQPFVDQLKIVVAKEQWLQQVLQPSVINDMSGQKGRSLIGMIAIKERELYSQENQQKAVSQKEKVKVKSKDKGIEL